MQDAKTTSQRHMATRRWPRAITELVDDLALKGATARQILDELEAAWMGGDFDVDKLPDIRTIERWLKRFRPVDASGAWRLRDGLDPDAAFLLATRALIISSSEGQVSELSVATAAWLRAVHAVAADLDPIEAYRLARYYALAQEQGDDTGELDAYLAYAPWRGPGGYEEAVVEGWIRPPARWLPVREYRDAEAEATDREITVADLVQAPTVSTRRRGKALVGRRRRPPSQTSA
jgi:hypothetical protein